MSTFSYETIALLRSGEKWLAFGNVAATNIACIARAPVERSHR